MTVFFCCFFYNFTTHLNQLFFITDVKLLEGTEYEKLLLEDGSPPLLDAGQIDSIHTSSSSPSSHNTSSATLDEKKTVASVKN
jgi:hypothetical protein